MPRHRGKDRSSTKETFTLSTQEKRLAAQLGMNHNEARRAIRQENRRLRNLDESFKPTRIKIHSRDL